jgi:hypothetical protein
VPQPPAAAAQPLLQRRQQERGQLPAQQASLQLLQRSGCRLPERTQVAPAATLQLWALLLLLELLLVAVRRSLGCLGAL